MINIYSSTLTSKGQATIPISIRKKLGLVPGQKIIFEEEPRQVTLKNQSKLINELYGSLKPKVKVKYSDKKADAAVGEFLKEQYLRKYGKNN